MKARGWKWSQPTVVAIEKGERPLKVSELRQLAEILKLDSIADLIAESPADRGLMALSALEAADKNLRTAATDWWKAQDRFRRVLHRLARDGDPLPGSEAERTAWLARTPAQTVDRQVELSDLPRWN